MSRKRRLPFFLWDTSKVLRNIVSGYSFAHAMRISKSLLDFDYDSAIIYVGPLYHMWFTCSEDNGERDIMLSFSNYNICTIARYDCTKYRYTFSYLDFLYGLIEVSRHVKFHFPIVGLGLTKTSTEKIVQYRILLLQALRTCAFVHIQIIVLYLGRRPQSI